MMREEPQICKWKASRTTKDLPLFASCEPHSRRERSCLPTGKGPEIWRVDVVHHGVGVFPGKGVHHLDPRRPQISPKSKFLLQPKIQACVSRKTRRVWRAD